MKRIQALDILRGIAMLGLVFMHAVEKVGHYTVVGDIWNQPWYIFLPVGLIMYFASWRGLFLMISGAGSAYSFQKAVEKGTSPHILLVRRLCWSILLFFHGIFIQVFWNPYYGLYYVFQGGTGSSVWNLAGLQFSDAVQTIAVSLFISSIIQYLYVIGKEPNKIWLTVAMFLYLTFVVFGLKNYVIHGILDRFPWQQYVALDNPRDRMLWMALAILIGEQEPLFPYMASFFIGCAIGLFLTYNHITKKKTLIVGYSSGLAFIFVAMLVGAFKDNFSVNFGIIPNDWFLYLATGTQLWVITSFLWIFDFSKKAQKLTKYTKTIRKAGILSLTIFTFQSLDFFPRRFLTFISQVFGAGTNFVSNGGHLSMGNSFITGFVVLVFWIVLILIWGLINYALTVDWLFEILRQLISWQKINWKDPLQSRDIIYKSEIVFFAK